MRLPFFYLSLMLCACGLTLPPQQVAAQSDDAASVQSLPFLTLRNKTAPDASQPYYGDSRGALSAGYCDVADRRLGALSSLADAVPFSIDDDLLRVTTVRDADPETALDALEETSQNRPVTLYTHGFFIDFEKGCRRATVLEEKVGLEGRFLWFSWPSDGNLFNYASDESDLAWSVPDMADAIAALAARFGDGQVNVMGHSLGGRGMALAIYDVAARHPEVRLGELVLLAPDMDFDIFHKLLPRLRPIVSGITIYTAGSDRPLAVSEQLHGYPRLGQSGNDAALLEGVEVIDLSNIPVNSPTGHLYHIHNDEVGRDLNLLLNEGLRASERANLVPMGANLWDMSDQ